MDVPTGDSIEDLEANMKDLQVSGEEQKGNTNFITRLPPEIRNLLYELLFWRKIPIRVCRARGLPGWGYPQGLESGHAILYVSKQIRTEAVTTFFSINTFAVGNDWSEVFKAKKIGFEGLKEVVRRIPPRYPSLIRKLEITVYLNQPEVYKQNNNHKMAQHCEWPAYRPGPATRAGSLSSRSIGYGIGLPEDVKKFIQFFEVIQKAFTGAQNIRVTFEEGNSLRSFVDSSLGLADHDTMQHIAIAM